MLLHRLDDYVVLYMMEIFHLAPHKADEANHAGRASRLPKLDFLTLHKHRIASTQH